MNASGSGMDNVLQAWCYCGTDRWRVYTKNNYSEYLQQVSINGIKDKHAEGDINSNKPDAVNVCKKAFNPENSHSLCRGGSAFDWENCSRGSARYGYRRIDIDPLARDNCGRSIVNG